jgi:hypothetical protein
MEPRPAPARYHFINLPHAHTIVGRIVRAIAVQTEPPYQDTALPELLAELDVLLRPFYEDPPAEQAVAAADAVAEVARHLVAEIEAVGYRGDRLGQCVRNLFECLGLAEEGAQLSLRCGERPDSPLRP